MSEVLARLQASIRRSPFQEWLGVMLAAGDAEAGTATVRLPFRPEFRRGPGADQIHGGVIAALADIAGDYALAMSLGGGVPTIDLRVDFLRPASATSSPRRKSSNVAARSASSTCRSGT